MDNPIKVLHLNSEQTWRGGEQQVVYLAEETQKRCVDVVIGCKENSELEIYCKEYEIPFYALRFKSAYDLGTVRKIIKICKQEGIDLIQTHTSKSHTNAVIAGLLGLKVPMIITRRVDFPVKNNWFSRFKYNYSKILKIICISDTIRRITAKDIKDQSKLVTIYSGINQHRFKEHLRSQWLRDNFNIDKNCTIIGNTAAIAHQKDLKTFVITAEKVLEKRKNVHFFIVGDGPQRREIEEFITSKNLSHKITLTGFRKNIDEVLPSLDIFLFTSKTEGLGTSVLDAMAARLPIVATAAGGVKEIIEHEKNGLLYPIKDYEGLSRGVIRLLDSPKYGRKLTQNALEVVKGYSKEQTAKLTMELYEDVLRDHTSLK